MTRDDRPVEEASLAHHPDRRRHRRAGAHSASRRLVLNGSTLHDWCLSTEVGDQEACWLRGWCGRRAGRGARERGGGGGAAEALPARARCAKTAVDAVKQYLVVHPLTGDGGAGADLVADALADMVFVPLTAGFCQRKLKRQDPDPWACWRFARVSIDGKRHYGCQSARERDPGSACNRDPSEGWPLGTTLGGAEP